MNDLHTFPGGEASRLQAEKFSAGDYFKLDKELRLDTAYTTLISYSCFPNHLYTHCWTLKVLGGASGGGREPSKYLPQSEPLPRTSP